MARGAFDVAECLRAIDEALDSRSRNPRDSKRNDARQAAAGLAREIERLRGERFDVTDDTTRGLAVAVGRGLNIMRDALDDDEDGWVLPDLVTINRAISALTVLVRHAADRQRFKRALIRLSQESETVTPTGIRGYVAAVVSDGGSWKTSPLTAADRCPRCHVAGGHTDLCPLRRAA